MKVSINKLQLPAIHRIVIAMQEIESILRNTRLIEIDTVWVLLYKGREYIRLLDANSRDDAERQIAELLLLASQQSSSRNKEIGNAFAVGRTIV